MEWRRSLRGAVRVGASLRRYDAQNEASTAFIFPRDRVDLLLDIYL